VGDEGQEERDRGARQGHTELFELATRQHGVVSTRQLRELGYGKNSAAKAHRVGRLRRIHRGVYAVGHEVLDWNGRCMAAVLAARPAVASHLSAAYLWGLLRYRPERIHVTVPTERRQRRGFRVHFAPLRTADLTRIERIPITSLARTQLDLAAMLPTPRLEKALERSEELRLFDLHELEAVLGRYSHHPGSKPLRQTLAIYRPSPVFTRSGLEQRFLALVKRAGLPIPAMNFNVSGYEVDAYWEPERFAVELDVYETHGSRAAFERDPLRQEDLKLVGVEMIRVTGQRLDREPQRVMKRLDELLTQRRQQLSVRR
jgi:hypothetical protein